MSEETTTPDHAIRDHAQRWEATAPHRQATTAHKQIEQRAHEIAQAERIPFGEAILYAIAEYTIGQEAPR